jgi:uncharacterized membrane protein
MFTFIHMTTLGLFKSSLILPVTLIIPAGMLLAVILLSVKTGQGGSRLSKVDPVIEKGENKAVRRDEDQYWKLGIIYFNPEDPALIVEKRFGVGWTLNFARPVALIIIVGIVVVLPTVMILATNWMTK